MSSSSSLSLSGLTKPPQNPIALDIGLLPEELMRECFSFHDIRSLAKSCLVNKRWRSLINGDGQLLLEALKRHNKWITIPEGMVPKEFVKYIAQFTLVESRNELLHKVQALIAKSFGHKCRFSCEQLQGNGRIAVDFFHAKGRISPERVDALLPSIQKKFLFLPAAQPVLGDGQLDTEEPSTITTSRCFTVARGHRNYTSRTHIFFKFKVENAELSLFAQLNTIFQNQESANIEQDQQRLNGGCIVS